MRQLTLSEYQTEAGVPLTPKERDALREVAPSVLISPSFGTTDRYDLTPGSYVGAVNLGSLAIRIRPKIPVSRVMFMVSYASDPAFWRDTAFDFEEDASLLEAAVPAFVSQARRALRRGPLQGYRVEEDALAAVRGRIRFGEQVRKRFGLFPPVEVRYEEFTEDVLENRLIKAALAQLSRLRLRSVAAHRSLRAFDSALERVRLERYDARRLPEVVYTRLNDHYRPAVELAKLVLRSASFELAHGRLRASSFLLDMNGVFEDFVYTALREATGASGGSFPRGAEGRNLYLDAGKKVRLEPDISWWEGDLCTFVGDIKYKPAPASGANSSDLYQLLAYATAADLPVGLLIYAAGDAQHTSYSVVHAGKRLEAVNLRLSEPPEIILGQARTIAEQVQRLRKGALQAKRETFAPLG